MLQNPISISVACVEFLLAKGISHKINIKSNAAMNNHLVNMHLISIAVLRLLGPETNIKRSSKKKKKHRQKRCIFFNASFRQWENLNYLI
jgi:hypothetical protein